MSSRPNVHVHDGVACTSRGDTVTVVYNAPARVHRARWLFDRLEAHAKRSPGGIRVLLVVLPASDPPDAPTRKENAEGLKRLGSKLLRLVTVPVGDAFWISVVRTVMRAMFIVQRQSQVQLVASTIDEGIRRLVETRSSTTPSEAEIRDDVDTLYDALGIQAVAPDAAAS